MGCQFGVPGGTYPPKNTQVPPPRGPKQLLSREIRDIQPVQLYIFCVILENEINWCNRGTDKKANLFPRNFHSTGSWTLHRIVLTHIIDFCDFFGWRKNDWHPAVTWLPPRRSLANHLIVCFKPPVPSYSLMRKLWLWRNRKLKKSDCRLVGTMKNL